MAKLALHEHVRIYPEHWPKGESCLCRVVAIDDESYKPRYVRVQEIERPLIDFLVPMEGFDKLESV
jgi:hypothetical protein